MNFSVMHQVPVCSIEQRSCEALSAPSEPHNGGNFAIEVRPLSSIEGITR
jgi:hypothetical protein